MSFQAGVGTSDEDLVSEFIHHVVLLAIKTQHFLIKSVKMTSAITVSFPGGNNEPNIEVTLALLGTSLAGLKLNSPLMDHDRANRLEDLCRKSLWTLAHNTEEAKELPAILTEYQRVFQSALTAGKNPFGEVTGAMICRSLGDQAHSLCLKGTTVINPFIHKILGDIIIISATEVVSFWKTRTLSNVTMGGGSG